MSTLLERLRRRKEDRGLMANLRCALVASKKHRAWPALHRLGVPIKDRVRAVVAALYATHPEESRAANDDFGATCLAVKRRRDRGASDDKLTPTERRFLHLLAAATEKELHQRVARMVLMAKSEQVPINYEQLATDLKYWLHGDRVKTRWAASFWAGAADGSFNREPTAAAGPVEGVEP